jgi:hypothetical protein
MTHHLPLLLRLLLLILILILVVVESLQLIEEPNADTL